MYDLVLYLRQILLREFEHLIEMNPLVLSSKSRNLFLVAKRAAGAAKTAQIKVPEAKTRGGPLKDEDRIFTNLYGHDDRMIDFIKYSIKDQRSKKSFLDPKKNPEDNYILRIVSKDFEVELFDHGRLFNSLPVADQINDIERSLSLGHSVGKQMISIETVIRNMKAKDLAVLLTHIKDSKHTKIQFIKMTISERLTNILSSSALSTPESLDDWLFIANLVHDSHFSRVLLGKLQTHDMTHFDKRQILRILSQVIITNDYTNVKKRILAACEYGILRFLKEASLEDITIISLAYFKSRAPISDIGILSSIIDILTEKLSSIIPTEPGYCSIIKGIRYSRNLQCRENVLNLVKKLSASGGNILLKTSYNSCQTIKLMENYHIYDEQLLDTLVADMFASIGNCRIKDIQYVLTSLSILSFHNLQLSQSMISNLDGLCEDIISERRKDASMQFYHLMPIMRAFAIFGYYNNDFIDYINRNLNDRVIFKQMNKVLEFNKSALLVHSATRIENSKVNLTHSGTLFEELSQAIVREGNAGSVRQTSTIGHLRYILNPTMAENHSISRAYRAIAASIESNDELKDPAYRFNFQFTLPHQNYADLVISKNVVPSGFDQNTLAPSKVPENHRCCLLLLTKNEDFVDGLNRLNGHKMLQARLMTKLGYSVIFANLNEPDIEAIARKIRCELEKTG